MAETLGIKLGGGSKSPTLVSTAGTSTKTQSTASSNPSTSLTTSGEHLAVIVETISVIADDESGTWAGAGTLTASNGCTVSMLNSTYSNNHHSDYYSYAAYASVYSVTKPGGTVPSGTTLSFTASVGGASGVRTKAAMIAMSYIDIE